jgi:hypothetical protein
VMKLLINHVLFSTTHFCLIDSVAVEGDTVSQTNCAEVRYGLTVAD